MDDQMLELTSRSDAEVVRRLEAYADLRLSPSLAARTRVRTAVMQVANAQAAMIAVAVAAERARPTPIPAPFASLRSTPPAWRRPFAALAAATLTLGLLAGSVLASNAGGPLYGARLWVEQASLPASGTARARGEVQRLDHRLEEVQQASAAGDEPATEAALTAYSAILSEATSASANDAAAATTVETAVTRHVVILTTLADRVPGPARAAIQTALASSTIALDDLHQAGAGTGGNGAGGNGGGGAGGAGGTGGGVGGNAGNSGGGAATAHPAGNGDPGKPTDAGAGKPTDKPAKDPAATHKPVKTDRPSPTPRNGHGGDGPANTPTTGPGGGSSGQQAPTP